MRGRARACSSWACLASEVKASHPEQPMPFANTVQADLPPDCTKTKLDPYAEVMNLDVTW